jgi:hypothetical protein
MGISVEILVNQPAEGYFVSGSTVSGVILYDLDKVYRFRRIVVSCKGIGRLSVQENAAGQRKTRTYKHGEDYFNLESVVQQNENIETNPGPYQTQFNFLLPFNIPPSLKYSKRIDSHKVKCVIKYYLRIKFEMPSMFQFDKRFRKEINLVSKLFVPRLSMSPTVYRETKQLSHLFSHKSNVINIKLVVHCSIVKPGEKVCINFDIENETDIDITCVTTKLVETYSFSFPSHSNVNMSDKINLTNVVSPKIMSGETKTMLIECNVPEYLYTFDSSNIVNRNYFVRVKLILPMPYFNIPLLLPIQIGTAPGWYSQPTASCQSVPLSYQLSIPSTSQRSGAHVNAFEDPPPTYWEAMNNKS